MLPLSVCACIHCIHVLFFSICTVKSMPILYSCQKKKRKTNLDGIQARAPVIILSTTSGLSPPHPSPPHHSPSSLSTSTCTFHILLCRWRWVIVVTAMLLIDEGELGSGPHQETLEDTGAASILWATYRHPNLSRALCSRISVGNTPNLWLGVVSTGRLLW